LFGRPYGWLPHFGLDDIILPTFPAATVQSGHSSAERTEDHIHPATYARLDAFNLFDAHRVVASERESGPFPSMGLNRYTIFPPAPAGFPLALAAPTAPTAAPAATIPAGSSISGFQLPLPLPQTEFTHPSNPELGLPAFAAVPYPQYALGNAPALQPPLRSRFACLRFLPRRKERPSKPCTARSRPAAPYRSGRHRSVNGCTRSGTSAPLGR
jgi:hypothetical protein